MAKVTTAKAEALTTEQRAKEIATQLDIEQVFVNSKGEFFTRKDYALATDTEAGIQTFNFPKSAEAAPAALAEQTEAAPVGDVLIIEKDLEERPELGKQGLKVGDKMPIEPKS